MRNNPNGVITDYAFQTQKINDIMHKDWKIILKQAGVNYDQCIDLYGIDGATLNSIDMEFFYEGDHLRDPMNMGKNYDTEDISQMLVDLEDYSLGSKMDYDTKNIIYEGIQSIEGQKEVIFNIVVAECMRGQVFNEIGDIVNLCVKYNDLSNVLNS